MNQEEMLVLDDIKLIAGAMVVTGLLILGHDVMKHGYSMEISSRFFNCIIAPQRLAVS